MRNKQTNKQTENRIWEKIKEISKGPNKGRNNSGRDNDDELSFLKPSDLPTFFKRHLTSAFYR